MKRKICIYLSVGICIWFLFLVTPVAARIKLVALPERGSTSIRLDNPLATLIEEERVLTLQKGLNLVDFSWKGVSIDVDSIRLTLLTHVKDVTLLSVSYPPEEPALVWGIYSEQPLEVQVRISYLLSQIDRLITYKGIAGTTETWMDLKMFLILRNFSGEDFEKAAIILDEDQSYEKSIQHGETRQLLVLDKKRIPIEKIWTFDARTLPWDPEQLDTNVGIPVSYRVENRPLAGLGESSLLAGKVRIFQEDGHGSTIFLGEDTTDVVPVGDKLEIYIGDSRDIVVTQRKMQEKKINIRRNKKNQIVLYDTDELIKATIENFKAKPATLTMIQHIPGQWEMVECNMAYTRKDAHTLNFEMVLPPHEKREVTMHYCRRNLR
ncbi:MAG: hypothetical protein R6V46_15540 [Desulfatiglandaceae bacterium]